MAATKKGKRRTVKQTPEKLDIVEAGHKVWFAGLGALARAQAEGPKMFDALVEEGAEVHAHARETTERALKKAMMDLRGKADESVETLRDKATETWENVEKIFQTRVQKALQQLGMPTSQEIRALTRKVDELTKGVEGLSKRDRRPARRATNGEQGAVV